MRCKVTQNCILINMNIDKVCIPYIYEHTRMPRQSNVMELIHCTVHIFHRYDCSVSGPCMHNSAISTPRSCSSKYKTLFPPFPVPYLHITISPIKFPRQLHSVRRTLLPRNFSFRWISEPCRMTVFLARGRCSNICDRLHLNFSFCAGQSKPTSAFSGF